MAADMRGQTTARSVLPLDRPPRSVEFNGSRLVSGLRSRPRRGPFRYLPRQFAQWLPSELKASLPLRGQRRHHTGFPIIPPADQPESTLNELI